MAARAGVWVMRVLLRLDDSLGESRQIAKKNYTIFMRIEESNHDSMRVTWIILVEPSEDFSLFVITRQIDLAHKLFASQTSYNLDKIHHNLEKNLHITPLTI